MSTGNFVKDTIDHFENISKRANASTTDPLEMSPNDGEKEHRHFGTSSGNDLNVTTTTPKRSPIPVEGSPTIGIASRQVTGNEEATTSSLDISSRGSASEMSPNMSVREIVAQYNGTKVPTEDPQEMSPNDGEKEHRHLGTSSGNDLNVTTTTPKPTSIPAAGSPTTDNASRQVARIEEVRTYNLDLSSQGSASKTSPKMSVQVIITQYEKREKDCKAAPKPAPIPAEGSPTTDTASRQLTGNEEATSYSFDFSSLASTSETPPQMSVQMKITQYEKLEKDSKAEPTDPNFIKRFFLKCKKVIEGILAKCVEKFDSICSKRPTSSKGSESTDDKASGFDIHNIVTEACSGLESGLIFVIDGKVCAWDIKKLWEQRKERKLTPLEFLRHVCMMATVELVDTGLVKALRVVGTVAGSAAGGIAGTHFFVPVIGQSVGAFIGGYVGGAVGSLAGNSASYILARLTATLVKSAMWHTKRVVTKLSALNPGDHVILPNDGSSQRPRHAIIAEVLKTDMSLIRNNELGYVVKETVKFNLPVKRAEFDPNECRPPSEVVERARSKIDEEVPQTVNDGSEFASWCQLISVCHI